MLPKAELLTKPQLPPELLLDEFARPLTKTIDAKKNNIEIIPKKEVSINETNLSEQPTKFFQILMKLKKRNKMVKNMRKK